MKIFLENSENNLNVNFNLKLGELVHNFKKNDVVVVLLHDSGSRYIGKIYNDEWMKKNGFSLD